MLNRNPSPGELRKTTLEPLLELVQQTNPGVGTGVNIITCGRNATELRCPVSRTVPGGSRSRSSCIV